MIEGGRSKGNQATDIDPGSARYRRSRAGGADCGIDVVEIFERGHRLVEVVRLAVEIALALARCGQLVQRRQDLVLPAPLLAVLVWRLGTGPFLDGLRGCRDAVGRAAVVVAGFDTVPASEKPLLGMFTC